VYLANCYKRSQGGCGNLLRACQAGSCNCSSDDSDFCWPFCMNLMTEVQNFSEGNSDNLGILI